MTDNDDWHAGYREGLRDGRNISTELAPSQEVPAQPQCAREAIDRETVLVLLDLLNPLHSALDTQTYDERVKANFDAPSDAEYNVDITAQQERDLTQAVMILHNRRAALSGKPGAAGREAIARKIAAWIGYSWDGLPDQSAVERGGFGEWVVKTSFYQGGKPDLLRLADALMAHTRPELGREITREMIERGARAHCPFAFEAGSGTNWAREIARAEVSNEVRDILTAALSVTRPERCGGAE